MSLPLITFGVCRPGYTLGRPTGLLDSASATINEGRVAKYQSSRGQIGVFVG